MGVEGNRAVAQPCPRVAGRVVPERGAAEVGIGLQGTTANGSLPNAKGCVVLAVSLVAHEAKCS